MDFSVHLHHLRAESLRFLEAIRKTAPDRRVPTCPDWTADDLLWHLGGDVQWFWASVIDQDLREIQQVIDLVEIGRPGDRDGLLALFTEESARLHRLASASDPTDPRWMWVADESLHHVGYIARRQAHEALIHRVDAELTAGLPLTPIDTALATDGVDEAIRLMHGNHPSWGTFQPGEKTTRFEAIDTGDTWNVLLGRFAGTDSSGEEVDVASWRLERSTEDPSATIRATAADLDLWLWCRPCGNPPALDGDSSALATVQKIVGAGVD